MTDIILAICVGAMFISVFFMIKKLDSIVYKNRKIVEREDDKDDELVEVMISAKLPERKKKKED